MPRSAVTISLVAESRGGPFVFWDDLNAGCTQAAALGFDAVEIFAPSAGSVCVSELEELLATHQLAVAGFGTGAGWVKHKLRLTDPDAGVRQRAEEFVADIIDVAGKFRAPAVIGSMQGRWGDGVTRDKALAWLREALDNLAARAHSHGVPLLYEPLNRYETNLFCRVEDALPFLATLRSGNVKLLCDLFHMSIEERDVAAALRLAGDRLGHVHWADTNRHAMGFGHMDVAPIVAALKEIKFNGFLSAEVLPLPTSEAAASQTIASLREAQIVNAK